MTKEEVLKQLDRIADISCYDAERACSEADDAICAFLISLGYEDVVRAFRSIWRY